MMFQGELGKKLMIQQGYVPAECTLDDQLAGPLIFSEISEGRDPCAGCTENREKCGGRPPRSLNQQRSNRSQNREDELRQQSNHSQNREDELRRIKENPMPTPWEDLNDKW